MAPVGKNDIPAIAAFMTDFWHLVKATWGIEPGEDYRCSLIGRVYGLIDKYGGNRFVNMICLAYLDYMGEKLKDMEIQRYPKAYLPGIHTREEERRPGADRRLDVRTEAKKNGKDDRKRR